jgi:hypothetical protein
LLELSDATRSFSVADGVDAPRANYSLRPPLMRRQGESWIDGDPREWRKAALKVVP